MIMVKKQVHDVKYINVLINIPHKKVMIAMVLSVLILARDWYIFKVKKIIKSAKIKYYVSY